ncbi:MAG: methyltransferase [Alphaproteobacteria bacterium]|nr:methyltransferase [Alphaproteobacteria bacterium]
MAGAHAGSQRSGRLPCEIQVEPAFRLAAACRHPVRPPVNGSYADFVRAETRLQAPPLVPEIRLHLAARATDLWEATEAKLEEKGLPPPYWAFAWPGGRALARYILDNPATARGLAVLDFAAGCGIAAIAAALAGAQSVTASEIDDFALAALDLNCIANGVSVGRHAGDVVALAPAPAWGLILAGDVFYEKPMSERIWPWLKARHAAGARVLVADPGRAYLPGSGLNEIARYDVPTDLDLEDRTIRTTRVLEIA